MTRIRFCNVNLHSGEFSLCKYSRSVATQIYSFLFYEVFLNFLLGIFGRREGGRERARERERESGEREWERERDWKRERERE